MSGHQFVEQSHVTLPKRLQSWVIIIIIIILFQGKRLKAECWGVLEENATRTERGESIFMWHVCYLEWNSSAAFWVKRLRLTKKCSKNCKLKENLQNAASPLLQNRRVQFLPLQRGETVTIYKKSSIFSTPLHTLSRMLSAIHQVTNSQ